MVNFSSPMPPPLPPRQPPAPVSAPAPALEHCGNHPGQPARYHCANDACGFLGCSACVKLHVSRTSGTSTPWCWKCGERVIEIKSQEIIRAESGTPFYADMGKVLAYPFHGDGVIVFGIIMMLWGVATFLRLMGGVSIFGLIGGFVLAGFLYMYPLIVLRKTARGDTELPDLNDLFDPSVSTLRWQVLLFSLFYLLPSILMVVLGADGPVAALLLILQLALYVLRPMGLALLVEWGALGAAISPYHVIREIVKVLREYTILWAFNIPMLAIELALSLLTIGAGNVFTATDGGKLVGGIVLKFILNLVSYYFVIIQAHIMGRILRERRDVLTWAA